MKVQILLRTSCFVEVDMNNQYTRIINKFDLLRLINDAKLL